MKTVVVDVDLTILDPAFGFQGLDWFSWLSARCVSFNPQMYRDLGEDKCDYNLAKYFTLPEEVDPMSFWKQDTLYDCMSPTRDAIEVLNRLSEHHNVIFASYCKSGHSKSKYNMLKKYFPKMAGFHATKEKGFLRSDYIIEDRHSFLNQFTNGEKKFKMVTPYTQDEELNNPEEVTIIKDWYEFEEAFNEIEGR